MKWAEKVNGDDPLKLLKRRKANMIDELGDEEEGNDFNDLL